MTNSNNTGAVALPANAAASVDIGLVAMVAAMLLLPVGDTLVKLLTTVTDPLNVAFWRLLTQAMFLAPAALLLRHRLKGRMFAPEIAISAVLVTTVMICLITAFSVMPVATAIAIFFAEPLMLTLLAWPFLGERPGPRRLTAVGIGLVGALIVIRPSFAAFGLTAALPLLAALCYALNMIVMRRCAATHSALSIQCGATLFGVAGLSAVMLGRMAFGAPSPSLSELPGWVVPTLLASGALAAASFLLIAEAFRRVEAGLLAPLQYLEIIGATAMGWLVFRDFPDALTWLGVAIILGSGLYLFHRERRRDAGLPRRRRATR